MRKRLFPVFLMLCTSLMLFTVPALAAENPTGSCGASATWTFDTATGTLTISGMGAMDDFENSSSQPWDNANISSNAIETIVIESGITSLGKNAFMGSTNAASVSIPDTVTSIGDSAFGNCSGLTEVVIPESVTSIGVSAFGSSGLSDVVFSGTSKLESIGDHAFFQCHLTEFTIPASVKSLGSTLFNESGLSRLTIAEGVPSIGDSSFKDLTTLTSVSIPNTVTKIGRSAFSGCKLLESITIPGSVATIDQEAFSNCPALKSVTLSEGLKYIEEDAFEGCTSLTSLNIPASVVRITAGSGSATFERCPALTDINVAAGNTVYSSQDGVLFDKEGDKLLRCPAGKASFTIPSGVKEIGTESFRDCVHLTSLEIPAGVETIKAHAFYGCSSLENVVIPNTVTELGGGAFDQCTALPSITIPGSIKQLYTSYFANCTSLKEVTLEEGVEYLANTFHQYTGEIGLETIHIPTTMKTIANSTFFNCKNLTCVIYAGTETMWGAVEIGSDNAELTGANIEFLNQQPSTPTDPTDPTDPIDPTDPTDPTTPETLTLQITDGGLGKKVTCRMTAGQWITIQTRRSSSISITAIQAPAGGNGTVTFSAAEGSQIQVWVTAQELSFSADGSPSNPILATATAAL